MVSQLERVSALSAAVAGSTGPLSTRPEERQRAKRPLRLLTFTTLFPNREQPHHGVFVENRLRHLVSSGEVESVVVAPIPYFPRAMASFSKWGKYARVDRYDDRHGLSIYHPRFLAIPRVGMNVSPALLAAHGLAFVRRLLAAGVDFDAI